MKRKPRPRVCRVAIVPCRRCVGLLSVRAHFEAHEYNWRVRTGEARASPRYHVLLPAVHCHDGTPVVVALSSRCAWILGVFRASQPLLQTAHRAESLCQERNARAAKPIITCIPLTVNKTQFGLYSAPDPAWYCSSLTFSIHSAFLPSSCSTMAMCVMAVVGVAPCQCFSPGGNQITSPE